MRLFGVNNVTVWNMLKLYKHRSPGRKRQSQAHSAPWCHYYEQVMWWWNGREGKAEWCGSCEEKQNKRCYISEEQAAMGGLHCHLGPCWCPRATLWPGSYQSEWPVLPPRARETSGPVLQLRTMSGLVALLKPGFMWPVLPPKAIQMPVVWMPSEPILMSEGHADELHCHTRPWWCLGCAVAKGHVWVHSPITAWVCVDIHGMCYNWGQWEIWPWWPGHQKAGPTPHLREVVPVEVWTDQLSYHSGPSPGFQVACLNIYPIYDLLRVVKGWVLPKHSHKICDCG